MNKGIFRFAASQNQTQKRGKADQKINVSRWLLTILFVGSFVAGLYGLQHYELHSKNTQRLYTVKQKQLAEQHKPHFEFYSMLPQSDSNPQAAPPSSPPSQTTPATVAATPAVKSVSNPVTTPVTKLAPQFILQVAAFKKLTDADHLKTKLTLLGYDVKIESTHIKDAVWHRVKIGPYATLPDAQQAKLKLSKNKYATIVQQIN